MLRQEPPNNKIFNRQTLKLSYSCMPNMKTIIASHKKTQMLSNVATTPNQNHDPSCNCRKKAEWPMMVNAFKGTTVTTTESYVGLAQHILPKRQQTQCNGTIWTIYGPWRAANKTFLIKWKVLKKFKPDKNINKKCNLCLHEKFISVEKILVAWTNAMNYQVQTPHRNRYVLKTSRKTWSNRLYHGTWIVSRHKH